MNYVSGLVDYERQRRFLEEADRQYLASEKELYVAREKAELEVKKTELKEQVRQDIKTSRAAKAQIVRVATDGYPEIQYQLFTKPDISCRLLNIRNCNAKVLLPIDVGRCSACKGVLCLTFITQNEKQTEMFFDLNQVRGKDVVNKFGRGGIPFLCRAERAEVLASDFLSLMRESAGFLSIPLQRGFFEKNGKWFYASDESRIWSEVQALC